MKRRWWWALVPLGIGTIGRILIAALSLANPVLYLRSDLGTLLILIGGLFSLLTAFGLFGWGWLERTHGLHVQVLREEATADRRRFLQRLDHELKNPLTAIQAGLGVINDPENPNALESIKGQTLRVSRLVADLRKLAELEARPLERGPVALGEILENLVDLACEDPSAAGRRISLTVPRAPWPLPVVPGDYDLLLLAIHNLLNNALKFSRPGDTIEARALEDGTSVVVEIADTGPGIPDGEVAHIWEELYRGEGARGIPGSGLGLALARSIVERHGGSIALRSRAGQGTVVSLRLPQK